MSLTTLPRETIDQIFSHLEWPEIRNLRESHRRLAEIGLEYFPQTVTLAATKWSLQRVNELLSLETVRTKVKTLSICCYVYLPDFGDKRSVKKTFNRHCRMIRDGDYLASLKTILQKLPSLESVIISDYPRPNEILPRSPDPQLWREQYLYSEGAPEGKKDLVKQVLDAILLRFADSSLGHGKLSSLEYSYGPYGLEESDTLPLEAGLDNVKHLKLGMSYERHIETGNYIVHIRWGKDVGRFTAKLKNLESLHLELTSPWASFEDFSMNLRLPKLKKLALSSMLFDARDLLQFFSHHKSTLESLSLSTTTVMWNHMQMSWFTFFKETEKELSLKSLALSLLLQQDPDGGDDWPTRYPDTIPPERAIRYLVSSQKTNMQGEEDAISQHPYDWRSITWNSIKADFTSLSRPITNDSPVPEQWQSNAFAPERWIPSPQTDCGPEEESIGPIPRGNQSNSFFGSNSSFRQAQYRGVLF